MTETDAKAIVAQDTAPQFEPSSLVEYGSVSELTQLGGPITGGPDAGAYS